MSILPVSRKVREGEVRLISNQWKSPECHQIGSCDTCKVPYLRDKLGQTISSPMHK